MTLSPSDNARLDALVTDFKANAVPFAMATVVRTLNSTSAKPGGKALIDQEGAILVGWVGGGCARGAVSKAARRAIAEGQPQFISLRPQELLDTDGLKAGDRRDGVQFERNGCPSKGTMDIFVEPVLPLPHLVVFGSGLVATALAQLGGQFDFKVAQLAPDEGGHLHNAPQSYIVVATQGSGDAVALSHAMGMSHHYVSFVGSKKKFAALTEKLVSTLPALAAPLAQVYAPAGLHINAITPEEIALSVLAQITQIRRGQSPGRVPIADRDGAAL